jgi:hypothetical protein
MPDPMAYLQEQLRKDQKLLDAIKVHLPELEQLVEMLEYDYEDRMYRFYYQSFKVYELQSFTTQALDVLQQIAHAIDRPLSPWFTEITAQGIGVHFAMEHNRNWLVHTRPIVEAFLHAKYFVEMMVKYGREMDTVTPSLPSGWAALPVLYQPR